MKKKKPAFLRPQPLASIPVNCNWFVMFFLALEQREFNLHLPISNKLTSIK